MSSTVVVVADWIKRIADDERRRDAARRIEDETAARKADLVRRNGQRLIDELRATVERDIDAFSSEFPGDAARAVVVDAALDGGFVVRRASSAGGSLSVTPNLIAAVAVCTYRFVVTNGMPPREDRLDVLFVEDATGILQMKHRSTGQVFANAEALSEFLLVPVLTGRPR